MSLRVETFNGAPLGSNLSKPPHEIEDSFARYVRDAILDVQGNITRRGKVEAYSGVVTSTDDAYGLLQSVTPAGSPRVGVIREGLLGELYLYGLSSDLSAMTSLVSLGTTNAIPYYDSKPSAVGVTLFGHADHLSQLVTSQGIYLWGGATKALYSGASGLNTTRGSTSATITSGTLTTNAEVGMYVFAPTTDDANVNTFIGEIKSIESATAFTFKEKAIATCTNKAFDISSVKGIGRRYATGRITCVTTSTTVTGSNTRFADNDVTASWALFRKRDLTYIGKVASLSTTSPQTSITLTANAAVAMDLEEYVAIKISNTFPQWAGPTWDVPAGSSLGWSLGWLNAPFAGRQFYGNSNKGREYVSRLYYSEPGDIEAVDQSTYIPVTGGKPGDASGPLTGLVPTASSLLVLKESEAFALTGASPTQFRVDKVGNDGCLSPMSIQTYQGGALYAGREGVYFFDGIEARNIVEDRLGPFYKKAVGSFDTTSMRMYSMLYRDHYVLHITEATHDYVVNKNGSSEGTTDNMTIVIHLPSRAVTFFRNVELLGAITPPESSGRKPMYLINTSSGMRICNAETLFTTGGVDALTCFGAAAGPDLYIETKRYSLGDHMWQKLFKQLKLTFLLDGANLKLETIVGLNETGTLSVSEFQESQSNGSWITKRIKFLRRGNHIGFRIYQASSNVTALKIGPWQIGFKPQSPGRI